jgi:hypothetical protein
MENKFEIGSQWKTRGGWRAVVVNIENSGLVVWHSDKSTAHYHYRDGSYCHIVHYKRSTECEERDNGDYLHKRDEDLIELWKEPREFEVDVKVTIMPSGMPQAEIVPVKIKNFKPNDEVRFEPKLVATKRITIKEGEFIDE